MVTGAFRRLPVTSAMLTLAGFCFALRLYLSITRPDLSSEDTFVGALQIRLFQDAPEIYGMFKLWEGEWWRIFVNPFYHAGLVHLFFNSVALWILGDLLERRFGAAQFIFFCCMSCLISSIPELLIEVAAIGLSGIIYAMFGALLVLRASDDELAERFGKWPITIGIAWLFLCIPLTAAGLLSIANGAHFAGLVFGIVFTVIQFEIPKYTRNFARLLMLLTMGVTACLVYLTMHPVWVGRYHAWRSTRFPDETYQEAQEAVEYDPELPAMWIRLAQNQARKNNHVDALQTLLKGIKANRTNERLVKFAKREWSILRRPQKIQIVELMQNMFRHEAAAFITHLGFEVGEFVPYVDINNLPLFGSSDEVATGRLDQRIDLPFDVLGITKPLPPERENGEVDPDDPDSARFGESL
jgi:membrane associated rhomboid family serine protease